MNITNYYTASEKARISTTWPDDVPLDLQESLEVLEPLHLVVQVPERGLLALQDLVDGVLLSRVLRLGLNLLEKERHLHDVVHGRHQEVRQLQLLTAGVLVTPLNRGNLGGPCYTTEQGKLRGSLLHH